MQYIQSAKASFLQHHIGPVPFLDLVMLSLQTIRRDAANSPYLKIFKLSNKPLSTNSSLIFGPKCEFDKKNYGQ